MIFWLPADFFQNYYFFKKIFQERYQCVKQFGSRSAPAVLGPNSLQR